MLELHPESDLSLSILVLGSEIIEILKAKNKFIIIEEIMTKFLKKDYKRTPDMFFDTLVFLFSIKLIVHEGYKVRLNKNDFSQKDLF